ncbi:hypothetical protein [Vreelandella populi]|uniref:hypothetical protein n=1 Tax=Vreelandella populi TaxID=2498858 RepID=UPI000F8D6A47|nr:hypothetical protein [Halomonas populi]RUR52682.1 hypothetical protein ELY40_11570 [Halomonas populi]
MKITLKLSPMRTDNETKVSVSGTILTVNGIDYDLSEVPDGAIATHSVLGRVSRSGDEYECAVILGHGPNAPHETRFPQPIVLENHDGPVELPLYDVALDEEEVTE